jgi:hypothetical protein
MLAGPTATVRLGRQLLLVAVAGIARQDRTVATAPMRRRGATLRRSHTARRSVHTRRPRDRIPPRVIRRREAILLHPAEATLLLAHLVALAVTVAAVAARRTVVAHHMAAVVEALRMVAEVVPRMVGVVAATTSYQDTSRQRPAPVRWGGLFVNAD